MAAILILIVFTFVIIFICKYAFNYFKPKTARGKVLPGPKFWESIQGFRNHKDDLYILFMNWKQKYGNLFACNFGPLQIVVLNDYKIIKEGFSNPHLQGRAEIATLNPFRLKKSGIVRNDGKNFELTKKMALRHLRQFDFGRGEKIGGLVEDEIMELCQKYLDTEGTPVNMRHQFFFHIFNTVWITIGGLRLTDSPDDQEIKNMFQSFFKLAEETVKNPFIILVSNGVDYFPWIPSWKKYQKMAFNLRKFIQQLISEHKTALIEHSGPPTNFIGAYLNENCVISSQDSSLCTFVGDAEKELEAILMDFVFGGFETTSSQFDWVMHHLVVNQDCQSKLHQELDSVIGQNRLPTLEDRPNLPYTEACVLETLRMSPAIPVGLFHVATADTLVAGYEIKKGATIISNLYVAGRDPDFVSNPKSFQPPRFLNADESHVIYHPYVTTFSWGARACPGSAVAKDTLFLLTASIFHKFHVTSSHMPHAKSTGGGMLLSPPNYSAIFKAR